MRVNRLVLVSVALCAALIAAFVSVFSSHGPAAAPLPHLVALGITAPTNGATVGVRRIVVSGTVSPQTAVVTVAGHPAKVHDGSFAAPLELTGPSQTIAVLARAPGYRAARGSTTVRFSSATAAQLTAAQRAATKAFRLRLAPATHHRRPAARPPSPSSTTNASPGAAFNLPGTRSTAGSGSGGAGGPGTSGSGAGTSGSGAGTSGSSGGASGSGGSGGSGSGSGPGSGSGTVSPAPVIWTQLQIHDWYLRACSGSSGYAPRTPFCQCTYHQLALTGAMRSRQSLVALVRRLKPYDRTHDPAFLPVYVHRAILDCVQYLPDNNVSAPPVLHRLPSLSYPAAPAGPAG